jgi:hypothetical protein
MTYTAVNPHVCCNGPHQEDAHAVASPPPHPHASSHLTNNDRLRWKTDGLPPANGPPHNRAAAKTTQHIHTSPGPAQTPHAPPQPAEASTTHPKPRSGPHYGTEFSSSAAASGPTSGATGSATHGGGSRARCLLLEVPCKTWVSGKVDVNAVNHCVQYNQYMGGCDVADMKRALGMSRSKTYKWYFALLFYVIDVAVINAGIVWYSLKGQTAPGRTREWRMELLATTAIPFTGLFIEASCKFTV